MGFGLQSNPWAPAQPGLQSTLGSQPPANPWAQQVANNTQINKPVGFWGSITNPLGLVTGLGTFASGLTHVAGGAVAHNFEGGAHLIGAGIDALHGDTGGAQRALSTAGTNYGQLGQAAGDFGAYLYTAGESLQGDATHLESAVLQKFGGPDIGSQYDQRVAGFNKWLSQSNLISDQEAAQLRGPDGTGAKPQDFWQVAKQGGVGASVFDTAMKAAVVSGAGEGIADSVGGFAQGAADKAASMGDFGTAAKWDARASAAQSVADSLHPLAHPVATAADALGNIGKAADAAVHPAALPVTPATVPDTVAAVDEALHPTTSNTGYKLSPELAAATEAVGNVKTEPVAPEGPVPPGMTRLYNGGSASDQTMWTDQRSRAISYAGDEPTIKHIDVPDDVAKQMKTTLKSDAHAAAMAANHTPNTATDYYLTPGELDAYKQTEVPREAPRVTAKVEPDNLNVAKGRPDIAPADVAARFDEVRAQEAAARAAGEPITALRDMTDKITKPPEPWAQKLADTMPPYINQVLAHFKNASDYRSVINAVNRVRQVYETAQNDVNRGPLSQAFDQASSVLTSDKVGRPVADRWLTEEVARRAGGQQFVAEFMRSHGGALPDDATHARLYQAGQDAIESKDQGLQTPAALERIAQLTPEERVALEQQVSSLTQAYKGLVSELNQKMLATRFGAHGIEAAVLGDRESIFNAKQTKMYNDAMRAQDIADRLEQRTKQRVNLERDVNEQELLGDKQHGVVQKMYQKLGVALTTVQRLFDPLPKGLDNAGAPVLAAWLQEKASGESGATIDVGTGQAVHPDRGIAVSLSDQAVVDTAEFDANPQQHLHDVVFNPVARDGSTYMPDRLWGGNDARLGVWQSTENGKTYIDISVNTNNGVPIEPWQAHIVGMGFKQKAGFDFATGQEVPFSQEPGAQDLAAHFVDQALDPKSELSKFANEMKRNGATDEQVTAGVLNRINVDQSFGERPPLYSAHGAYDPLSTQYRPQATGVDVKQARWESDAAFARRARQYGEARTGVDSAKADIRRAEALANRLDKNTREMQGMLLEPTRDELLAARLRGRSEDLLNRLSDQLSAPGANVPTAYRFMMSAYERWAEAVKADPSGYGEQYIAEVAPNFGRILQSAQELGFEPTHLPDLTWQRSIRYLYGHFQLGEQGGLLAEASLRKENTGVLQKFGLANRSYAALGAGSMIAMQEFLRNHLASWVEDTHAREWDQGVEVPKGWHAWDAVRDKLVTGKTIEGQNVTIGANKIIPDDVYRALQKMQKPMPDMPFRFLLKGGPTAVWRMLMVTYSAAAFVHHFVGSIGLATLDGVKWGDWAKAWDDFKTNHLPGAASNSSLFRIFDEELGYNTVARRNGLSEIPDVVRSEGYRQAAGEVAGKIKNVIRVVDSISRAAVYEKTLRLGGSVDEAGARAYEAMGDFGRLSPIERGLVTSIMPFWSFQKAMFRIMAKMPIDHPLATSLLWQAGTMHEAYMKQQLGGTLPSNYTGSDFIDGKLTKLDKLFPLTDSYKLATPEGLASSLNPFLGIFAQDALNSPTFGGHPAIGPNGEVVNKPSVGDSILNSFTGAPAIGAGSSLISGKPSLASLAPFSALSTAQYQKLVHRIAASQVAVSKPGGYVQPEVFQPKSVTQAATKAKAATKATAKRGMAIKTSKSTRLRTTTHLRTPRHAIRLSTSLGRSHHKVV